MVDHESVNFSPKTTGEKGAAQTFSVTHKASTVPIHTDSFLSSSFIYICASAYIEGDFLFWICATFQYPMGQYLCFFDHQFLIPITRYPWRFLSIFWGVSTRREDQAGRLAVFSRMICLYNDSLCVFFPLIFLFGIYLLRGWAGLSVFFCLWAAFDTTF